MIRIGIVGYGNLARGAQCAIAQAPDMTLAAVFTRRNPESLNIQASDVPVVAAADILNWKDKIDVLLLCGGSAKDLPQMTPELARHFHVVDSFDTHADIPAHFARVDAAAKETGHLGVISTGWDPGMFSLARLYASALLPQGQSYTFWGKGVSQGHSDAVRRIPGVLDCRQYTIPVPEALERVRKGENPQLTPREKHTRHCFVVAAEEADRQEIAEKIKAMPNYFSDYDTTVEFLTQEELDRDHAGLPHGGTVIHSGTTGWQGENRQTIEYTLTLDSNPQFTGSVLAACARAVWKLHTQGMTGCITLFDIPPSALSPLSPSELLKML